MIKSLNFIYLTILIAFLINCSSQITLSSCDAEHSTVCGYSNGTKACCPIKEASCCQDSDFCCPRGFTCDSKHNRCVQDSLFIPFHLRTTPIEMEFLDEGKDILCQDNQTYCKDTQTCCLSGDNDYGCCPLAHAICCSDNVHCCPKNYKCNPKQGKCDRISEGLGDVLSIDWVKKQPGNKLDSKSNSVCPDGKSQCQGGSTCCELSSGDWGCCPLPEAVCCQDHLHCCPKGYSCDVKDGRCNKGDVSLPFYTKVAAIKVDEVRVEETLCPGGDSECPSGTTCCQLESGDWGCCPLTNAVCCADHLHCCPHSYICDVKNYRCTKGEISIPFFKKMVSKFVKKNLEFAIALIEQKSIIEIASRDKKVNPEFEAKSVVCPDGCSFCPNKYSCCRMSDGSYGCCPLPNAICCEDHLHCCPEGSRCNLQKQSCDASSNGYGIRSWLEKIPSKLIYHSKKNNKVRNDPVVCADNTTTCDPLKTCCKMADDSYGCCPYPDGVCCSELSFCCPSNTVCGKFIGECLPNNSWETIELKAQTITEVLKEKEIKVTTCPGTELECNGTCCTNTYNDYACCPYANGTCCGSGGLCCPNGYNCNPRDETCTYDDPDRVEATKIFNYRGNSRRVARQNNAEEMMVECEDAIHYCPDSSTCCKTKDTYGCCAIQNAVCCDDGINCCPSGFKCSTNSTIGCYKSKYEQVRIDFGN